MCTKTSQVLPDSAPDALGMMDIALDFLNSVDVHALGAAGQAEALAALGRLSAKTSAFHAAAVAAFDAVGGPEADGCKTSATWLAYNTQSTKTSAKQAVKWSRMLAEHPVVAAAMTGGQVTEAFAKLITTWTAKLPEHMREGSEEIMVRAARGGCGQRELELIAAKLWEEHKQSQPDPDDEDDSFGDRALHLNVTYDGAGRVTGDLSPECAAALQAVLDSLAKHRGADDDRTLAQRQHDALAEACDMLLAARMLPDRAGAGTRCETIIDFTALRQMDGASVVEDAWLYNNTAGEAAYLTGTDAEAACCDASLVTVVTGHPDWVMIEEIIEITLKAFEAPARQLTVEEWTALQYALAKRAIDFCSGLAGIGAALRRALAGEAAAAISLPLDVGFCETIPEHIRRMVKARDKCCRWPGCDAPPARCQCHHIRPKRKGGVTALHNCILLCWYHHQVCIHRIGWVFYLLPDGSTQAVSPDGTKVLRSHSPPPARG
jgi:hypothetical protein